MSRRVVVALGVVAGTLITVTPAAADSRPWAVTDTRPDTPWSVTRPTAEPPTARRATAAPRRVPATGRRVAGHRRAATGRRLTVRTWRATRTCRSTLGSTWRVGPGDTLWLIARCHPGVTVDQLRARNGIRGDRIRVGQVLQIPAARR